MKNGILALASAFALLSAVGCSDTDSTTTQSVGAPDAPVTSDGTGGATASGGMNATPQDGPVNATSDNTMSQNIETETDKPESGTGGSSQTVIDSGSQPTQPRPPASTAQ